MEKIGDNIKDAHKLNKGYNWSPYPEGTSDGVGIDMEKHYPNTANKSIGIGDPDAVMKFREWESQYWLQHKDLKKKKKVKKK